MSEWISVNDRLPEHMEYVLMVVKSFGDKDEGLEDQITPQTGCYGYYDGDFREGHYHEQWCYLDPIGCGTVEPIDDQFEVVTHWMELPELPKD